MAGDKHRRPRTRVTLVQFVTAMLTFVVLSAMGGLLLAGLLLPVATAANSAAQGSAELFEELPDSLSATELPQQSNIYDRTGKHLLATFYDENRVVVPLAEISPWIQKAVVAVEDKRFFDHHGVDGQGIARAAYINLTSADSPGGSTLTQQLIKNMLLQKATAEDDLEAQKAATEVSITRKIREWRLALAYEERADATHGTECTGEPEVDCGKEQVLEQYLNIAQFGTRIYGVEAAAQVYFGKPAAELNAIEAATIAGITQNPTKWDPLRNQDNAQKRRNVVLYTMYQQDMISEAEFKIYRATAIKNTLDVHRPKFSCAAADEAPFFCDYITKLITRDEFFNNEEINGKDLLYTGGLTIITTLDYRKQRIANQELRRSLDPTDKSGWAMALVSLDVETGQILAMAQNRDYDPAAKEKGTTSINYAVDREWGGSRGFSPGSTFKPVVLAEWLNTEHGLMQSVAGVQREYKADSWQAACLGEKPFSSKAKSWKPQNAEGGGASTMTVARATAFSVNTAYVAMANQMDLCGVKKMAETLGFERADGVPFEVVPSAVLGTQNASPMTMASINQVFANKGVRCEPIAIRSITDADGNEIPVPEKSCERVISKEVADGVAYGMQQVMEYGSGRRSQLADGRPSAGKTGTSQFNAHAWFTGYTPQLVTAVWLGNPDRDVPGRNIRLNGTFYDYVWGSSLSAPTWQRYMDRALEGEEIRKFGTPTEEIMYGIPREVPSIIGKTERDARAILSTAGFALTVEKKYMYSPDAEPNTCIYQTPEAGSKVRPGKGVTCVMATDELPSWWYNWPSHWDPNNPPDGYWGNVWPPPEWETNPPAGWNPNPDGPDGPGGGPGGGGPGGGGPGPGGGPGNDEDD